MGRVPPDGTGVGRGTRGGASPGGRSAGSPGGRRRGGSAVRLAVRTRRPPGRAGLPAAGGAREDRTSRGGVRAVISLGYAATLLFLVLLWYAAIRFGHDSRDGQDWDRHPRG
ncbi:MAG: hypothetical protein E6G61_04890 [Actinobacteria bacterium]|nr:MAG: hypothetical protein E6G61_04890 [Actinomycetota bacterium]